LKLHFAGYQVVERGYVAGIWHVRHVNASSHLELLPC
jgi:hypothetical protein